MGQESLSCRQFFWKRCKMPELECVFCKGRAEIKGRWANARV